MTFQDILNRNSKRGYWKAALAICYEEQPPPLSLFLYVGFSADPSYTFQKSLIWLMTFINLPLTKAL